MSIKSNFTIPARKRSKRARSAVNPWIRIPLTSSSASASEKTSSRKETRERNGGKKELKKCAHCEATKTPQWREGPMGRSTLCNACGVRYRSGRLFPEYRPAASPTFVPTLHSNSHRKVVKMRRKAVEEAAMVEEGKKEEMVEVPVLLR